MAKLWHSQHLSLPPIVPSVNIVRCRRGGSGSCGSTYTRALKLDNRTRFRGYGIAVYTSVCKQNGLQQTLVRYFRHLAVCARDDAARRSGLNAVVDAMRGVGCNPTHKEQKNQNTVSFSLKLPHLRWIFASTSAAEP